ncbi:MAG: hypothetical protein HY851_02400 [candidate division Zixibacteria bacterium]|nr:hypothetical protein [candidate division Zixibacteria bacterium]
MKKTLILALAALMLLSAGASATITRVTTLGNTNNILLDEANVWLYPARINMYPNFAAAEAGGDIEAFGVHWKFGDKNPWVLGTYFYTGGWQEPTGGSGGPLGLSNTFLPFWYPAPDLSAWVPLVDTVTSNTRFTLFYGRKLGNNPFGFYLNAVHASFENETVGNEETQAVNEYDFGVGLTDANGKWDLAAGLNMFGWTYKVDATSYDTKPKGNTSFWANGRMFKQLNPQWTIVPNGGFIFGKYQADDYNGDATMDLSDKYDVFSFFGGIGAHYTPAANMLAVGEFGIAYGSIKNTLTPTGGTATETKDNIFTLPYFKAGFEGKVFDWLDLRLGATSYWQRSSEEIAGVSKTRYNYPDNVTYLGTGMHFGNLHLDTYANPAILQNGFNFISGETTTLNYHVSVLYEFK